MVHPTAINLTPPSFFSSATRNAPKKRRTALGVLPWRITLNRDVRTLGKPGPPSCADAPILSLRCCGERPCGPPAEPFGKDQIAVATASSMMSGMRLESSGGGGRRVSG